MNIFYFVHDLYGVCIEKKNMEKGAYGWMLGRQIGPPEVKSEN